MTDYHNISCMFYNYVDQGLTLIGDVDHECIKSLKSNKSREIKGNRHHQKNVMTKNVKFTSETF